MKYLAQIVPLVIILFFITVAVKAQTENLKASNSTTLSETSVQSLPDLYHNHIHTFGSAFNDPSLGATHAFEHRHALVMGYSMVSEGKPDESKYVDLGILKNHNAKVFPINLRDLNTSTKKFLYRDFYHEEFVKAENEYRSAFDPTKFLHRTYPVTDEIISFIKGYACAKPGADLNQLTLSSFTSDLLEKLFYTSWRITDSNGNIKDMTLLSNWQSRHVVDDLAAKTVDTLNYESVDGIFFDELGGWVSSCSNAGYFGDAYTEWSAGQKDFLARVSTQVKGRQNRVGKPYFLTVNIGQPNTNAGYRAAQWYKDGSLRFDHYYAETGNVRDPTTHQISVSLDATGLDPATGKPAFINKDGGYIPANLVSVDTESGWYTFPGVLDRQDVGRPYREDDYRDNNSCELYPDEDDYFTQHLRAAGMAAKQGSWFGWYKGWLAHKDYYICENGKPRLKTEAEKELVYTNDKQLLQALPNWENMAGIPVTRSYTLPTDPRFWDEASLIYKSENSFASKSVIYSRHYETNELFVVFMNNNSEVILKPNEAVKSAYFTNKYFEKSMDDATRCLSVSGNRVKLKAECSDKLGVGIRISSVTAPFVDGLVSYWNFDEGSGNVINDSISGNNGTVNGATFTEGALADGLKFDGVDDYVVLGDILNMETSDMSISFWINTTASEYSTLISKAFDTPYYNIIVSAGKVHAFFHNGSQPKEIVSATTVNDGKWHHVAVTWDRDGRMKIYIDAVEESSIEISQEVKTVITNNNYFSFARNCKSGCANTPGSYFKGILDEIRVYNKTLTAGEVENLYKQKAGKKGDANGDGKVDGLDYVIWLKHYNQTVTNGSASGDFNENGKVDGQDYVIWLNNYTSIQNVIPTLSPTGPFRAFSPDSYWNTPFPADAPVDPNNAKYIADSQNPTHTQNYLRFTAAPGTTQAFGEPIYWATGNDPLYSITPSLYGKPIQARIPKGAKPNSGSDGNLIVFDLYNNVAIAL